MTWNTSPKKWMDHGILALTVFLLFCLLFESYIRLPLWLAWAGKWHPMVLHFPIVLLLLVAVLGLANQRLAPILVQFTVLATLVTAISGFFLASGNGEKGDLLFWHQYGGSLLALLAGLWYFLYHYGLHQKGYAKGVLLAIMALTFATGHFGASITHGEDFLAFPKDAQKTGLPENPNIYAHVVHPILETNCIPCHNPNKQKGALLMTSLEGLLKGGEMGNTIVPGSVEQSELLRRLHLPKSDEEHMPPDGKKPLDASEIAILERWIALGASDTLTLDHLGTAEPLADLVKALVAPQESDHWKELPIVADSTLQRLASDYLTVQRVANHSQALTVNAFKPPTYDPGQITALKAVSQNVVALDLSNLPLGPDEIQLIAQCSQLHRLDLDGTPITSETLGQLVHLDGLQFLKLHGTALDDGALVHLAKFKNLKKLYAWNTGITEQAMRNFKEKNAQLTIEDGLGESLESFFLKRDSISGPEKENVLP